MTREEAIKWLKDMKFEDDENCLENLALDMAIKALEEPKSGYWDYTDAYPHWVCCDKCHKRFIPNKEWIKAYNIPTNYCPNCGCRMVEED